MGQALIRERCLSEEIWRWCTWTVYAWGSHPSALLRPLWSTWRCLYQGLHWCPALVQLPAFGSPKRSGRGSEGKEGGRRKEGREGRREREGGEGTGRVRESPFSPLGHVFGNHGMVAIEPQNLAHIRTGKRARVSTYLNDPPGKTCHSCFSNHTRMTYLNAREYWKKKWSVRKYPENYSI